ncbi:hypothetical protein PFISCL1PPCAC_8168, partial [Pristionchus fissidentatus]
LYIFSNEDTEQFISVLDLQWVKGFDAKEHNNDIVLLHLSKPLRFNQYVQPICLPDSDENAMKPGHDAWFTSWGSSFGNDTVVNNLREAELFIDKEEVCETLYRWYDSDQHLCVGGVNGQSTCF